MQTNDTFLLHHAVNMSCVHLYVVWNVLPTFLLLTSSPERSHPSILPPFTVLDPFSHILFSASFLCFFPKINDTSNQALIGDFSNNTLQHKQSNHTSPPQGTDGVIFVLGLSCQCWQDLCPRGCRWNPNQCKRLLRIK